MKQIKVWAPKYSTDECLILASKAAKVWGMEDKFEIVFTQAKHLKGKRFIIDGKTIRACPIGTNGTARVYRVPMVTLQEGEVDDSLQSQAEQGTA